MNELYEKYRLKLQRVTDIGSAQALMNWDQEIYMPPGGAAFRAQQLSTLAGIAHEMSIDKELGVLISQLLNDSSLGEVEKKNIKQSKIDFDKRTKLPTEFVEEMSRAISEAFQAWQEAKKKDDFSIYAPKLEKIVELKLREAEFLGYEEHPYDALIDLYEPGMTASMVTKVFEDVMPGLKSLLEEIKNQPQLSDELMYQEYDKDKQWDFSLFLLEQMGYDFNRGRQDISSHPFTIHFNSDDVRVTTRVNENDLAEILWSTIHEGGHALYEQGIPSDQYGLPAGEYISLGVHESQSRLWENNVGRSLEYWQKNFPLLQRSFPEQLGSYSVGEFYKAMNKVQPSLIRTSADELTYHFHIYIRFVIEKELLEKKLKVSELPARWNSLYKEYLGEDVPSDAKGVLQDIHWSHGSFGYFPTYSLGSFYAAQFFNRAEETIDDLRGKISRGELKELLSWLRANIHRFGKQFTAVELCEKVTGKKLDSEYFLEYARKKFRALYNIS